MTTFWIFEEGHPLASEVELLPALTIDELHNTTVEQVAAIDWREVPRGEAEIALEEGRPVIFSEDCNTYLLGDYR